MKKFLSLILFSSVIGISSNALADSSYGCYYDYSIYEGSTLRCGFGYGHSHYDHDYYDYDDYYYNYRGNRISEHERYYRNTQARRYRNNNRRAYRADHRRAQRRADRRARRRGHR